MTSKKAAKSPTNEWLKSNKLSHLIPAFAKRDITIAELSEMDRNDLTDILKALGLDAISIPRVRSKIMKYKANKSSLDNKKKKKSSLDKYKKNKKKSKNKNEKQKQKQQVIITEEEKTAMQSLNDKMEQLKQEQKSIESTIEELKNEQNGQKQIINDTFDEIITNIKKRKKAVLKKLSNQTQSCKQRLQTQMEETTNKQTILSTTVDEYNKNIENFASVKVISVDKIQERSKKNVVLIETALSNLNENAKSKMASTNIKFEINKSDIMEDIKLWGKIITGYIPVPKALSMYDENRYGKALIEVMLSEYGDKAEVTEYEFQLVEGKMDEKQADELDVEKIKKFIVKEIKDNIAYYELKDLRSGWDKKYYSFRVRGVNEYTKSEWTKWIPFSTETQGMQYTSGQPHKRDERIENFWNENVSVLNAGKMSMDEWLKVTEKYNVGRSEYQRKRFFYGMTGLYTDNDGLVIQTLEYWTMKAELKLSDYNWDWKRFCQDLTKMVLFGEKAKGRF